VKENQGRGPKCTSSRKMAPDALEVCHEAVADENVLILVYAASNKQIVNCRLSRY